MHSISLRAGTKAGIVLAMLAASAVCIAIAPTLMPDSYSVVEHAVSESAAQGVEGAWLARTAFLLLGFAVLVLAGLSGERWGLWGRIALRLYGVLMIAAAAFSNVPWEDVPADEFEDLLHSIAASGMGLAFTVGVLFVLLRRDRGQRLARAFDVLAIVAAFAIPMIMFNAEGIAGVVQRILFGIAYLWFGGEAVRSTRVAPTPTPVAEPEPVLAGR